MIKHIIFAIIAVELFIALFIWLKNRKDPVNISFAGFSICIALWTLSLQIMWATKDIATLNFWAKMCYVGPIVAPTLILYFVQVFPENTNKRISPSIVISALCALILLPLNQAGLITSNYTTAAKYTNNLLYYLLFVPYFLFFMFSAFKIQILKLKILKGKLLNQAKYVFYGLLMTYLVGTVFSLLLPMIGYADLNYLGAMLGGSIFIYAVAYAIIRYQFMDIRVTITKTGVFVAIYAVVLGFPFMVGYYKNWFQATILMFLLASIGPAIYRIFEQKTLDAVLKTQSNYRRVLLDIAKGISAIDDLNKLLKIIIYIIKATIGTEFAAIFAEDERTSNYRLEAARNRSSLYFQDYFFPKDHPLIRYINNRKTTFSADSLPRELDYSFAFTSHAISLIVPCFIESKLVAFIALGRKKDGTPYGEDDIHLFEIISRQAALAITNLQFLKEFKRTNERIFAAEKLASIGGMASGIAHQIGNRITQFNMGVQHQRNMIKILEEKNSIDAQLMAQFKNILNIFEQNVKSLADMAYGILNFTRARTDKNADQFSYITARDIIALILDLLKTKHGLTEHLPVKIEKGDEEQIYAIKSHILEAFLNIIDNAYESIEEKFDALKTIEEKKQYTPGIRIMVTRLDKACLIEISDNGMGISPEAASKMFTPFFTTKVSSKKSGTGIGMYVVKRMVEESLKGKLWYKSKPLEGTSFFIELPLP